MSPQITMVMASGSTAVSAPPVHCTVVVVVVWDLPMALACEECRAVTSTPYVVVDIAMLHVTT